MQSAETVLNVLRERGRRGLSCDRIMAKRRRKTLVVCKPCHDTIHDRQPATLMR